MSIKTIIKSLTEKINLSVNIELNNKKFIVPIIKNMGHLNRAIKNDWFYAMLRDFQFDADSVFIDVGVNVGQTLLKFKSCQNAQYIGFEPNPSCAFYVSQLIKCNRFNNVNIYPVGLSYDNHIARFFTKNDVDSAGTTLSELRPGYYDSNSVTYVPVFAFDNLKIDNLKNIGLIKIDVEGGELEVLQGMTTSVKKYMPPIVCEILDSHTEANIPEMQKRADKLITLIKSLNYDVYRISYNKNAINLEKIDVVTIKKWTESSWDQNDYLFLPTGTNYQSYVK